MALIRRPRARPKARAWAPTSASRGHPALTTNELGTMIMIGELSDQRLCNISTLWSVVALAHDGGNEAARAAQHRLLELYGGAIRRYLTASLRDPAAAEELFQEFALRFLNGNFQNADPRRGRFRDYVKTSLVHLIGNYRKQRQRQPRPLNPEHPEPTDEAPASPDLDPVFLASCAMSCWRRPGMLWPRPRPRAPLRPTPCSGCVRTTRTCRPRRWPPNSVPGSVNR